MDKADIKYRKCKITVIRREYYQDLADQYLADPTVGKCQLFKEGQEFIVDNENYFCMMNGKFCSEAWAAISHYVYSAINGGSIMRGWTNDEKMMITCCNDGVRPVIFKLERIDE
ncbi:TIGR04076 family protein [Massilibacteroides vaginae]|uniref:TIGR04076 family protein n=1 Tax=Massilibacteroides vaginae TaxID=1673718 RepID=UPI000A1CCB66|nr:TIGR04076 family protein [Massilibacteroides vaginae]